MLIMPSFKKSLIVEQFQGNYLKTSMFRSLSILHRAILKGASACNRDQSWVNVLKWLPCDRKKRFSNLHERIIASNIWKGMVPMFATTDGIIGSNIWKGMVPMFATTDGSFPCVQNEGLIVHNPEFFSIIVATFVIFFKKNIRPTYNACAYFSDEVMATAFFFYSARRRNFATTYVFSLLLLRVITMLDIDTAHHVPAT